MTQRKVVNWIRLHQPRVPSEISECGGAGTGCGWCVPFLRRLFDAAQQTQSASSIELDAEQYAAQREAYVKRGRRHEEQPGAPDA